MAEVVALVDYGAGNLHSLAKAIEAGGVEVRIEEDPTLATDAAAAPSATKTIVKPMMKSRCLR